MTRPIAWLAPLVRIALRVLAGALMAAGWLAPDFANWLWTNGEIVGAVTLLLTEGWYWLAKRYGWTT